MKTTIEVDGLLELVLTRAVDTGLARSKTDALRIGVLALNNQYHLVGSKQDEQVIKNILSVEKQNKKQTKQIN